MWLASGTSGCLKPTYFLLVFGIILSQSHAFPFPYPDNYRLSEKDYASPGAHQLASWIASQLSPKQVTVQEGPIIPYRLPLQGKRNSEVTNAIIGSEETQKMYRDGK